MNRQMSKNEIILMLYTANLNLVVLWITRVKHSFETQQFFRFSLQVKSMYNSVGYPPLELSNH